MTDLRGLLASNIKIYRRGCGLSQAKLAELVSTATNYIAAIEAGRRFPSEKMLNNIAFALKIDTPELFSMKPVEYDKAKNELQEQIWTDIGQDLSNYISKKLKSLKKHKKSKSKIRN
jgi:transcriptional regulator with XRE-family HTH domain